MATVGGLGRVPWAPGTWGSVVGLALGWLAAHTISPALGWTLLVLTFAGCAHIGTRAERQLAQHDPPAVILDEVWGMAAVVIALPWTAASWGWLLGALALFRVFDIVKPPPLKRLARLPAGWGIMADDAGASAYTILIVWVIRSVAVTSSTGDASIFL
ncbi:MAG: phosphatidylglycerophosphatase A [Candidatus Omnitrophica bacterium]|nr:phosphatidylglycerophosphatase A [Candidatus Omnitrophota bacterium]